MHLGFMLDFGPHIHLCNAFRTKISWFILRCAITALEIIGVEFVITHVVLAHFLFLSVFRTLHRLLAEFDGFDTLFALLAPVEEGGVILHIFFEILH